VLSPNIYLALWIWGLVALVVAYSFVVRARRYYIEPRGLNFLRRGLARYSASNYRAEGAVLLRRGVVALLVFVLSFVVCFLIHWVRFGARG
jgi:hypothetical protein